MAVTQNLKGTSYPSFKIHKSGPTFYQGTVAPNISAVNGDMYIQHGTGGGVWVYNQGWKILETGANDAVDTFEIYNSVRPTSTQKMYVLQGETTDATETELSPETTFSIDTTSLTLDSISTTSDQGSANGRITIPDDSAGLVEARIIARDGVNNENAGYIIKGVIVNDAGTTVLLTDPAEEIIGESNNNWYALIQANNNGNDSLGIRVSGSANATVRWTAFVNITLVNHADPNPTPTYSLSADSATVNEGGTVTFTLTTTNVADGTTVAYTVTGIDANDLSAGSLTGNITVNNNTGTVAFTIDEDVTTEGQEVMTLTLDNGGDALDVVINDTSVAPTYSLSADNTTINEGDTVTVTLTTTNVADGTTVAYTVTGVDTNDLSAGSLTGNFTINSGTGTAVFTLAEDVTTEGNETLTLTLDNGGSSINITVTDTSTAPAGGGGAPAGPTGDFANLTLTHTIDNPNAYNTAAVDLFGDPIAADGDYAIVCAQGEDDASGSPSGKAYIINVPAGTVVSTLDNPSPVGTSKDDLFGFSASISGNYAIVGAYQEDEAGGALNAGKAYIFKTTLGDWSDTTLAFTLDDPNPYSSSAFDYFGYTVDISGNYAIVGAYREDDATGENGKAYIFDVTTGNLVYTINNPDPDLFGSSTPGFGWSVSIDGNNAIVGMPDRYDGSAPRSGFAFIFSTSSGDWTDTTLSHTLSNPNAYSTADNDYFGRYVHIKGNYASVTAPGENENLSTNDMGIVYIFNVTTGSLLHTLDNPGSNNFDRFGNHMAIDGDIIVVGSVTQGTNDSGKAYVFNLTDGSLLRTIDNPNAYGTVNDDQFGGGVGITGNYVIAGAITEDETGQTNSGKVYIFTAP